MSPPPFDVEMQLSRHGAALRLLAGELVRDPAVADDAVQEVWLRATQRPPQHDAALGGWFATALRNVVRGWRRQDWRRVQREAEFAAARGEAVEDHAVVAAREELAQRLVAAVAGLDAPFREAIWQRYFEGRAPREIAAAGGVPVATVKSRLQRGLGMLREKLGERDGGGWRAGLVVAFGLREGLGIGVAAAAWPGVLLMTAWMKSAAAALLVAGAGLLWWTLRDPEAPVAVVTASAPAGASAVAADLGAKPAVKVELGASPSVVERSSAPPPAAPSDPRNATLRGRCVDELGAPLAGCTVSFIGWAADEERVEAWTKEHGSLPPWEKPARQITATDGRFAFEFPTPPFHFALHVARVGFVTMSGTWRRISERQAIDVGDVVCQPGVRVAGVVVDDGGRQVVEAHVALGPVAAPSPSSDHDGSLAPNENDNTITDDQGRFLLNSCLMTGRREVLVRGRSVVSPKHLDLALARTNEDVRIVVRTIADQPTISGRVVDETGQPIAKARIVAGVDFCETRRDGGFLLLRRHGIAAETAVLSVGANGFEASGPTGPLRWGAAGIELRLVRGSTLRLRVIGQDDAPVTDFKVRMIPRDVPGRIDTSPDDARVRARGPFVDGVAPVPGITLGRWLAVVEFPAPTPFVSLFENIEVTSTIGQVVTLRPERAVQRALRVVRTDGSPVAGTRVQLCELFGRRLGDCSRVFDESRWFSNPGNSTSALVLSEGLTDANGIVNLRGRSGRNHGVRLLGPGHVPCEVDAVRLDVEEDLRVEVRVGARLVGRIVPAEAVAELRRIAAQDVGGIVPREFAAGSRPHLWIEASDGTVVPDRKSGQASGGDTQYQSLEIHDDGTFEASGAPAGECSIGLYYFEASNHGGIPVATGHNKLLTKVWLRDGETTQKDLDFGELVSGVLEGEVVVNGLPCSSARVVLLVDHGPPSDGRQQADWIHVETDDQGRFVHRGRAGAYALRVMCESATAPRPRLRAGEVAIVNRGETTRQRFSVQSGTLRLKVLDSAGRPMPNFEVFAEPERWALPATDGRGLLTCELTADLTKLVALPKRLQSPAAQAQVRSEGGADGHNDPLAKFWITLGTATITAAETTTLELRLPPEWEK